MLLFFLETYLWSYRVAYFCVFCSLLSIWRIKSLLCKSKKLDCFTGATLPLTLKKKFLNRPDSEEYSFCDSDSEKFCFRNYDSIGVGFQSPMQVSTSVTFTICRGEESEKIIKNWNFLSQNLRKMRYTLIVIKID